MVDFDQITGGDELSEEGTYPDVADMQQVPVVSEEQASLMGSMAAFADTAVGEDLRAIDLGVFNETAKVIAQQMIAGDENRIRQDFAQRLTHDRDEMLKRLTVQSLEGGNEEAARASLDQRERELNLTDEQNRYAIEELVPSAITEDALRTEAQSVALEDAGIDLIAPMEQEMSKRMMFGAMVNEKFRNFLQQNPLENGIDLTSYFLLNLGVSDFRTGTAGADMIDPDQAPFFLNKGKMKQLQMDELFKLPMPEFKEALQEFSNDMDDRSGILLQNEFRAMIESMSLMNFTEEDIAFENLFVGVDIGVAAIPGVMAVRNFAKMNKQMKNFKAARNIIQGKLINQSAKVMGSEAVAESTGRVTDNTISLSQAMKETIPNMVDTKELADTGLTTNNEALVGLENNTEVLNKVFDELRLPGLLNQGETQLAMEKAVKKASERYGSNRIENYTVLEDGRDIKTVDFWIGKQKGGGYATARNAKEAAETKGFNKFDIVESDGRHFIKVTESLDFVGAVRPRPTEEMTRSSLGAWLLSTNRKVQPEDFFIDSKLVEIAEIAIKGDVFKPLSKKITTLKRKQKKSLESVLEYSREANNGNGKWLKGTELRAWYQGNLNRDPTSKEIEAYYTYKDINDIEFLLRNAGMRAEKEARGIRAVNVESPFLTHGVDDLGTHLITKQQLGTTKGKRAYNANTGEHIDTMSQSQLDELFDDGYEAIMLERVNMDIDPEIPVKIIFAKKGSVASSPLPDFLLNYRQGPHVVYANPYFIKQAKTGKFGSADDAPEYVDKPLTIASAGTKAEAQKYADRMNEAIKAINDYKAGKLSKTEAYKVVERAPIEDSDNPIQAFEKLAQDRRIDLTGRFPVEVVADREDPKAMRQLLAQGKFGWGDEAGTSGVFGLYDYKGKAFQSARGEDRLMDVNGGQAKVLSPFQAMNRSMENASRMALSTKFRIKEISKFVQEAERDGVFTNAEEIAGLSDMQKYFQGKINAADFGIGSKYSLRKLRLNEALNFQTVTARAYQSAVRGLADAMGQVPVVGKQASEFTINFKDTDPFNALRSFAFDAKLGFFAPAQMLLQTQTMFSIQALDPLNAAKNMGTASALRMALINGSDELTGHLAQNSKLLTGIDDPQEFKDMVTALRKTRVANVGNELAVIDNFPVQMNADLWNTYVGRPYRATRDAGRLMFFEAERWNRLAAFSLSWRRLKASRPDLDLLSDEGLDLLTLKTDDFSMTMTGAGVAPWQRGPFQLGTQFQGYGARLLEAMLPVSKMGSPAISGTAEGAILPDKAKLAIGQFLMYGQNGLPLLPFASDQYQKANGNPMAPEDYKLLTQGMWDVLFGLSGVQTDFGSRAGAGNGLINFIVDLSTKGFFEEFTLQSPPIEISSKAAKSVWDLKNVITAGTSPEVTMEMLQSDAKEIFRNFSFYNDTEKAFEIWNTQKLLNAQGDIQGSFEGNSAIAGWLRVLGTRPGNGAEAWNIKKDEQFFKKKVSNHIKDIQPYMRDFYLAEGDQEKQLRILKLIRARAAAAGMDDPRMQDEYNRRIGGVMTQDDVLMKAINNAFANGGSTTRRENQAIEGDIKRREQEKERRQGTGVE